MADKKEKKVSSPKNSSTQDESLMASDREEAPHNSGDGAQSSISAAELVQQTISGGSSILLNKDSLKNERFPILDVVFDKFIQHLSLNLRNLLQINAEARLKDIRSVSFNDYLDSLAPPSVFNIFKIEEWATPGLIMLNNNMIYSLINILLGGKKYTNNHKVDERPYSPLEFNLVGRFVSLALEDLRNSFAFVCPIRFVLDQQESNPKLIGTIPSNSLVSVCSIKIDVGEFSGLMDLVIPHTSLDPIREKLLKKHMGGDTLGQISTWRPYLTQELLNTELEMSAVLLEEKVLLSDVLNWKQGTTLNVEMSNLDAIILRCENIALLRGKLGHHNGMVAIEVEDVNLKDIIT